MVCCWTTLFVVVLLYKFFDWFIRKFYIGHYDDRYILVTGCDMGFGYELAKRLDKRGCHVFAGCLTDKGQEELKKVSSDKLHVFSLDVSKPESVKKALEFVKSKLPAGKGLWGIMNNAGILGPCGVIESQSVDDYKLIAGINLYGLIDVTMTFLPLIKTSRGRVVNTASIVGRFTMHGCVPYCVSKYGVESFTDGLRRTLYPFGCKALLIEPGIHMTHFMARENIQTYGNQVWNKAPPEVREEYGEEYFRYSMNEGIDNLEKIATFTTDYVVDAYEHALLGRFPRARYLVGRDAKFLWMPIHWLPEWLGDWIIFKMDPKKPLPAALLPKKND